MMKKRIVKFLAIHLGVVLALFSIRGICVLVNLQEVKDNAYAYRKITDSYAEIGYKAAKDKEVLTKKTLGKHLEEYKNRLIEVSVDNELFLKNNRTFKSILNNFISTKYYSECENNDYIIQKVDFNLECTEALVYINNNNDVVQHEERNGSKYILEDRSKFKVRMIKEDGTWKVLSDEILNMLTGTKDLDGNPI